MIVKNCETCHKEFHSNPANNRRFCSRKCYGIYLSSITLGVPHPWQCGKNNVNYKNKAQNRFREKFLIATRKRGLAWTEEDKKAHSIRMLGPTNKMRGKHHTKKTKKLLSDITIAAYKNGERKITRTSFRRSKPEFEIENFLKQHNIKHTIQFRISETAKFFDFFLPDYNILIEYNGDYYHLNPKKYKAGVFVNFPHGRKVLPETIWERDKIKHDLAIASGYKLFIIWESDYLKNGVENTIKSIISI